MKLKLEFLAFSKRRRLLEADSEVGDPVKRNESPNVIAVIANAKTP
jgi:hypothetical protein